MKNKGKVLDFDFEAARLAAGSQMTCISKVSARLCGGGSVGGDGVSAALSFLRVPLECHRVRDARFVFFQMRDGALV